MTKIGIKRSVTAERFGQIPPTKISIVVPSYNEGESLLNVVRSLVSIDFGIPKEVLVIDDGSTDGSVEGLVNRLHSEKFELVRHEKNLGKGAAIRSALKVASGSHLIVFDADGEYDALDVKRMLRALRRPRVVVVYGSRMHDAETLHPSLLYYIGNRLMTFGVNLLFGAAISDLHTCLKLFPLEMLKTFTLTQDGFGLDSEITAEMLRRGYRPFEVPVSYIGRSRDEGKKINFGDSLTSVFVLVRVRLRRG